MADYRLKIGDTLDIDISLNAGAADSGITYRMANNVTTVASVSSSGVVTPAAAGLAVVEAVNASNVVVRKFSVQVITAAEAALYEAGGVNVELSGSPLPIVHPQIELE